MEDKIIVRGAREHNLKNVNITIPRNQLVVFTGLSGSGKSSLAFDTIYAEGQYHLICSQCIKGRELLIQGVDITLETAFEIECRIGSEGEHHRVHAAAFRKHLAKDLHMAFVDAIENPYSYGAGNTFKRLFICKLFPAVYVQFTPAANS